MKAMHAMLLAYGLLFALIWLIWLMGIVDGQVIIEAAGNGLLFALIWLIWLMWIVDVLLEEAGQ